MFEVEVDDVVRNYEFDNDEGFLYCLFEAVSNALYCSVNKKDIKITVQFIREYKANELTKDDDNFITALSVTDNGIGFTNENFGKFTKTIYKTNHEGGKGLGKIAFLKVFRDVFIESSFKENGKYYSRNFKFDTGKIKDPRKEIDEKSKLETTVYFKRIKNDFRHDTKKTTEYYAEQLLDHFYVFLHYLLEKKKKFEIKIIDDSGKISEEIINSTKLGADIVINDSFSIQDPLGLDGLGTILFDILHIKTKNIKGNKA
jgi:hypothetical protein